MKAGSRHATKEVFIQTASKTGEEIVTKGTRVTKKGICYPDDNQNWK